jgi:transcriptional regulator with PAS, ATPase and Fis domain
MPVELDILGLSFADTEFLKNQLIKNIKEDLNINQFSIDEGYELNRKVPFVLISGGFLEDRAKKIYPQSKIIVATRIINGHNLEQVMVLPHGKKVMVVNYPKEVTIQTINSLKELGLTHLQYFPYWPGLNLNYEGIDTAISPGHVYLCPDFIKHKIDLGRRSMSFSTFNEVILNLGLDIKNVDNFASDYIQLVVNGGSKIAEYLIETEKLSKNLEVVLNRIKDGIVTLDKMGSITVFNPVAEKLFNKSEGEATGANYKKLFKEYPELVRFLDARESQQDVIINVSSRKILASLTYIKNKTEEVRICTLNEVSSIQKLEENVRRSLYQKGYVTKYDFSHIKGSSLKIKRTIEMSSKFAKNDLTVLICGESGTGKELLAQAIHNASSRRKGPFIAINFAALPDNLVESELFGYEEGAFTGALKGGKPGLFEQAHNGTIFLDEIGDAPLTIQSRLLRVLQEQEVMRLGASKIIPINVRVIAATNKNLLDLVNKELFRKDLYYRIKVLSIDVPPLRERKEDIPEIIQGMLDREGERKELPEDILNILLKYNWPGNIRELCDIGDGSPCRIFN